MDYDAKLRESKHLIDRGQYTLSVVLLGNLLENLYVDFYQDILSKLHPGQRQVLTQREVEFATKGDKAAREKGFAGLPLGGKAKFFYENQIVDEGERILNRPLPQFKAFDPRLFRDIRNEATHGREDVVSEDEAELYYRQIRVLLLEVGLIQKAEIKQEVVAAGGLRSWKENGVIPHDDILHGNLQMDTYAADLWGVARNDPNTPAVYRDPVQFFQQTYLTRSLHSLLADVLKVLGGGNGDRVLQLRTPFGGGKTHTLIALYHVTRHRRKIESQVSNLPALGDCVVAAVQCEKFGVRTGRETDDGLHIHTLWGEIAYQLGGPDGYEYFRLDDENYTTPAGETIARLLRDLGQPCLILLDEILNHVEAAQTIYIGESTLGRQLMIFLKNLTEAVSASRNAALVYSLQASVREGLGAENLLTTLDHLVSRVDAKREPVSGGEVMRVVQRRLFRVLGDELAARQTAAAYADAYRKVRQAVGGLSTDEQHQASQEAEKLANRILDSYPFHPDLLDLMYHRWGALPSYQRTRGALQFLASVVYDLWEHGRDLQPLIGAGDVPLEHDNTRNAFFTQIGERENYNSVMDVDLTGGSARASRVDRRIASDSPALQRYRVGTRLATSVMLYSFGAREGEERGVTEADLVQAATVPGLDRMPLTTALSDLRNELLYLHYTGRRYRFETQPNLNKLIDDETKKFTPDDVLQRIQTNLVRSLQSARGAVIWPENSGRVNDHVPMLQVVYLPLEWVTSSDEGELLDILSEWLEFCGSTRREYKNGVVFALPGYMAADNMKGAAREFLAIDSLIRDKKRFGFKDDQEKELNARKESCQDRLTRGMLSLYEKVALPIPAENQPYTWRFIDLQSRTEAGVQERVLGALRDSRFLFDTITPDKLIALTALDQEKAIDTGRIVTGFYAYLNFTRLTSADAVAAAIARGVSESKLGYTAVWNFDGNQIIFPTQELIYFGRPLRTDEIDLSDAYLINATFSRELIYVPPAPLPPIIDGSDFDNEQMDPTPPDPTPPPVRKRYHLQVRTEKTKAFKVFKAIQNLIEKSDQVSIQIEVIAQTNSEYDQSWIRNAVEEPLDEADVERTSRFEG